MNVALDVKVHVYDLPTRITHNLDRGVGKREYENYKKGYEQYATELVIPRLMRKSSLYTHDPALANLFLVPYQSLIRYTKFKKKNASLFDAEFLEVMAWLREAPWFDRYKGRDHVFVFPSGRGASLFSKWRTHIPNSIFLSPEGDERSGWIRPYSKDVVIPGYRNVSAIDASVWARVTGRSKDRRPIFLHFRGSLTSDRPGEENFSEGVRTLLSDALSTFRLPRHLQIQKAETGAPRKLKKTKVIFTGETTDLGTYITEMSYSDFCVCPMGSSSWTLRLYDAILTGCIPVVVSDHVVFPWESRVAWKDAVIEWAQDEAAALPVYLMSLSEKEVAGRRENVIRIRNRIRWDLQPGEGGAFDELAASLQERYAALSNSKMRRRTRRRLHLPACSNSPVPKQGLHVLLVAKEAGCVLEASLSGIRKHINPTAIHVLVDACPPTGIGPDVHCTQTSSVLGDDLPMLRIPARRHHWYYQQLIKLKFVASSSADYVLLMDGDTVPLRPFPTVRGGRAPLLYATQTSAPAYFAKDGLLPYGYAASTSRLVGIAPDRNRSFVTQWQLWSPAVVREMLAAIERRHRTSSFRAILDSVPPGNEDMGFSEYTLYAEYAIKHHPSEIQLIDSSKFKWLRDPPYGLVKDGQCCPSEGDLCHLAGAGFNFVSWECSHATEVREGRRMAELAPPSLRPLAPPSLLPLAPPPPLACDTFAALVNLRAASPPEWCYQDPERRVDAAVCARHYVTWRRGGVAYASRCYNDGKTCRVKDIVDACPPPPPPAECSDLEKRVNLRRRSPPEWCNTLPERRLDGDLCNDYFVTWTDGSADMASRCFHDAHASTCTANERVPLQSCKSDA